jgi:hypothetical protein
VPPKDRIRRIRLAEDVVLQHERSSAHPIVYAFILIVERDGKSHTVRTCDNAHGTEEHHEHAYIGDQKQPPTITRGPVNDAMHAAEVKLIDGWSDIVMAWERILPS